MNEDLKKYGFKELGSFWIEDTNFIIDVTDQALLEIEKAIYVFTINDEILRIGSCKSKLRIRVNAWTRDVSKALQGLKSPTPLQESELWKIKIGRKKGVIYARQATMVTTPIGTFPAYLDEESVLIGKYQPELNRSKHR